MARSVSHYQLLGVSPHASHDEIRRAYRALAQRHHPDANPQAADEAMAAINAAWAVLSDPESRRRYDDVIGTTPRPTTAGVSHDGRYGEDGEDADEGDDDGADWPPPPRRPADLLLFVPVVLLAGAVATFAFSVMSESAALRTLAILMAPVTAGAFVAAPLFMMLRGRRRDP